MSWTFFFMFVVLKIPIVGAIWLIWWAVKQSSDPAEASSDDGGAKAPPHGPRPVRPHWPRRGPHGEPAPPSPPRVRVVDAKARSLDR